MKKTKFIKPPIPEVCDACLLEGDLRWDNDSSEWLCSQCQELFRAERKLFDYEDGKKMSNYNGNEW